MLDAAKSNRCASLLRSEPDHEELMQVAWGCLANGEDERRRLEAQLVPGLAIDLPLCIRKLCYAYQSLMSDTTEVGYMRCSHSGMCCLTVLFCCV